MMYSTKCMTLSRKRRWRMRFYRQALFEYTIFYITKNLRVSMNIHTVWMCHLVKMEDSVYWKRFVDMQM